MNERGLIVFVALGDSLTVGFQSPSPMAPGDGETPYTQWLERRVRGVLRGKGRSIDLIVVNAGVNGDSTEGMNQRFDRDVAAERPDYVIVWAGINDLYAGRTPPEAFEGIVRLYDGCRDIGSIPIGCTLTPVEEPWQMNEAIVELNRLIEDHCLKENILFVDLHETTTDASGRLRRELSNDGVHLNTEGYRLVAEMIYRDAVEDILESI